MRRHRLRPLAVALSAMVAAVGLAACSGDDDANVRRTDSSRNRDVVRRNLQDVPKFPRSVLRQVSIEEGGTTYVATYTVVDASPELVMQHFVDSLDQAGWDVTMPPTRFNEALRARWLKDDEVLLVSTGPAPAVDRSDTELRDVTAQYSLTLQTESAGVAPPPPQP